MMGKVATIHAKRIFDLEPFRAGQYYYLSINNSTGVSIPVMMVLTFFPKITVAAASAVMRLFIDDVIAVGATVSPPSTMQVNINDALFTPDDLAGSNLVLGSRLIPETTFRNSPGLIGEVYTKLLQGGARR